MLEIMISSVVRETLVNELDELFILIFLTFSCEEWTCTSLHEPAIFFPRFQNVYSFWQFLSSYFVVVPLIGERTANQQLRFSITLLLLSHLTTNKVSNAFAMLPQKFLMIKPVPNPPVFQFAQPSRRSIWTKTKASWEIQWFDTLVKCIDERKGLNSEIESTRWLIALNLWVH